MAKEAPVKSIRKTFEVIEELVKNGELGVQEIAQRLDMPKSTVHGHLRSLEQQGYVINKGNTYQASTKFIALGELTKTQMRLFNVASPEIDKLAQKTGEQAALVIEERQRAVVLYTAKGEKAIEVEPFGGQYFPMHTIAAGKALLAHLPDEAVQSYIETKGLVAKTDNTITNPDALYDRLDQIRQQGYALDLEEHNIGLSGIAIPIPDGETVKGAVNLFGPSSRLKPDALDVDAEIVEKVGQATNIIEVNLGYL